MRALEIVGLGHGPMVGVQFFGREDHVDDDVNELNIYLLVKQLCIVLIAIRCNCVEKSQT